MPRTMAVIGFTFFFSMWIFLETSQTVALTGAAVAIIGFAVSMIIKSLRREAVFPAIFLTILAASVLFTVQMKTVYEPALSLAGKDVSVTGKLCELPYTNNSDRFCYVLETISVDGKPHDVKILLSCDDELKVQPCDIVSFCGNVYVRGSDKTDIRENLMSTGVWLGAYTYDDITVREGKRNIAFYLLKIRQYTKDTILSSLPEKEATVLIALLLGDTSLLSDEDYRNSLSCGILHIFAVSGFNLSLFAMTLYTFLKKKKAHKLILVSIPMLTVLFIMAVTGFSQSCVRAGIMLLIYFVGKLFSQRTDALNSLGISVLVICFADPFQASSVGLQLSFFASGTVMLLSPVIERRILSQIELPIRFLNTTLRYIVSTFLISFGVGVILLPVTINVFGGVSLVAPIVNCFVVFASEWEMILGAVGVVLSSVKFLTFLSEPIYLLSGILSDYISETVRFFSSFRYAYIDVDYPIINVWLACVLTMTAIIILMKVSAARRFVYIFAISVLSLAPAVSFVISDKDTITFTSLNESCVMISYRDKKILLGNADTYECVMDIKEEAGGKAEVIMLENPDNNDFLTMLLREFEIEKIVIPKKTAETDSFSYYVTPTVATGYTLDVADNLNISLKYIDNSFVAHINANGKSILLMRKPGTDISKIPVEWLSSDILYSISDVPRSVEFEKYGHVIISADKARCERLAKIMPYGKDKLTFTWGEKTVLKISEKGLCKIH